LSGQIQHDADEFSRSLGYSPILSLVLFVSLLTLLMFGNDQYLFAVR